MTAMARQQPMSFNLRSAAFMDHAPLSNAASFLNRFRATRFALDQGCRTAPALLMFPTWRHTHETHCRPGSIPHHSHGMTGSGPDCFLTSQDYHAFDAGVRRV